VCEEVWCIKCNGQGHDKDHYLVFVNYLAGGGLMLLRSEAQARPSTTPALWCAICQIGGKHATDNYHLLRSTHRIRNNCSIIFVDRLDTMSALVEVMS